MLMTLFVDVIGFLLLFFIAYWFWGSEVKAKKMEDENVTIFVKEGVYEPSRVEVKKNKAIRVHFIRKDNTPCSETVVFNSLNKQMQLPIDKVVTLELSDLAVGEYPFSCQMNMYRGTLVIV